MRAFRSIRPCLAALSLACIFAGLGYGELPSPNAEAPRQAEVQPKRPAPRYQIRTSDRQVRVYVLEGESEQGKLIRTRPLADGERPPDLSRVIRSERRTTRRWLACRERLYGNLSTAEAQHDAWLEVVEKLELFVESDPAHLGGMADLIGACLSLLDFESDTSLGSNVCLLAARRARDFEELASPLEPQHQQFLALVRARLFLAMKLYPCAAQAVKKAGDGIDARFVRSVLRGLNQGRFIELEQFQIKPFQIAVYVAQGASPDPKLLWPERHFIVMPGKDPRPESALGYSLARRGEYGDYRYSLYFHFLNRSKPVRLFGARRPSYDEVRDLVSRSIRAAHAAQPSEKTGESR